MNWGEAIIGLQEGEIKQRDIWPIGKFIFRQVPTTIPMEVVPNMTSLPDAVKAEFTRRFQHEEQDSIHYENQFVSVDDENLIQTWTPSVEDCEAEDWI